MKYLGVGLILALVVAAFFGAWLLRIAATGFFGTPVRAGTPTLIPLSAEQVTDRLARQQSTAAALQVSDPKQILFGDLHVHSSFSMDAFQLTLPTSGGEGVHPVADACDFARYCAGLDFWSINDHANSLTQRRWTETIEAVRQCNEVSGAGDDPDLVSFLGWEWTQMGSTPKNHFGHKNVILRDLEADSIPSRPIAAAPPAGVPSTFDRGDSSPFLLGIGAFAMEGGHDMLRQVNEISSMERCALGVPVRELPADCHESVETPAELFRKLDDWGHAATVIPHGTVWGMYTPAGSSWDKQLTTEQHDPERQRIVEIYSGHGNAEEFRPWVATEIDREGTRHCPEPSPGYTPACWQAGEVIRSRCLADLASQPDAGAGNSEECEARAIRARQHFVDADRNAGPWTVPGVSPHAFLNAGQCTDCFQPALNYRPRSSVQYILALGRPNQPEGARRFRFGFIGSSDNHTARAGTGYKEVARREFTDARMGEVGRSDLVRAHLREPSPESEVFPTDSEQSDRIPSVAFLESERGGSFFLTGGLAAVHTSKRSRGAIFDSLQRRETYATSGPRILLWFDLLDPNVSGGAWPMGSEVEIRGAPTFRVRAAGSFEQKPGCPASVANVLDADRIASLCQNECYFPSDRRRRIDRIEVIRIRVQQSESEAMSTLIEDPWKTFACGDDPEGCEVVFSDPEFAQAGRDASYYVRAIEVASPVVDANPLGCEPGINAQGIASDCVSVDACFDRPDADDCRSPSEQRAWSSPIFVDYALPVGGAG